MEHKKKKLNFKKFFLVFGLLEIFTGFFLGSSFILSQQSTRLSANDKPTEIAENAVANLLQGYKPSDLTTAKNVDLAISLSPYLIIVNEQGALSASNASLDGKTPIPPMGVLESARLDGVNKITWEPKKGVRQAIVVMPFRKDGSAGYVIAGQSLQEHENRISHLLMLSLILLGIGTIFIAAISLVYTISLL